MLKIKKVAVVGTGVIGIGWIIRFLAHNKIVYAYDKNLKQKKILINEIITYVPKAQIIYIFHFYF